MLCSTLHFKLGLTNATLFLNVVSVHLKTSGNSDEIKVNFGEKSSFFSFLAFIAEETISENENNKNNSKISLFLYLCSVE